MTSSPDALQALEVLDARVENGDPIDYLRAEIVRRGLRASVMTDVFGANRARSSEVLNRDRALSLGMIQTLVARYGMDARRLVPAYRLRSGRSTEHQRRAALSQQETPDAE